MNLSHRVKLEEKLKSEKLTIGCYDKAIDGLSEKEFIKVLEKVEYGSGDVQVILNNQPYVVEIYHVDNEVDFELISESDYETQYGRRVEE